MATISVGPKKKKKEPTPETTPTFTAPGRGTMGFTDPQGTTFLGPISPQEGQGIQERFAPEQARLAAKETAVAGEEAERERQKKLKGLEAAEQQAHIPEEEPSKEGDRGFLETLIKGPQLPEGEELKRGTLPIGLPAGALAKAPELFGKAVKVGKGLSAPVSRAAQTLKQTQKTVTSKATTGVNQASMLSRLWSTKTGKAIVTAGVSQGFIEAYASALDSANMQMKEGISEGIVATVRNGGYSPMKGMELIRDVEDNVNTNEETIKKLGIFSLRARFLAKFEPIKKRIGKIRIEIDEARQNIRLVAANPIPVNQEQLALGLEENE